MYPLHLNYTTTLPCKTIIMKITIFDSACIEIKRKHGNLTFQTGTADLVSSTHLQISLTMSSFQSSLRISSRSCDISVFAHTMSGFSFYRPRKLYSRLQQ